MLPYNVSPLKNHFVSSFHAGLTLFVDGNPFPLPNELAPLVGVLCAAPRLSPWDLGPSLEGENGEGATELLHLLLKEGYLYPADD